MAELANSMTSDAAEEMAGSAMEVSYLYGFLASLYRTELSRGQLNQLQGPDFKGLLESVDFDFTDAFWDRSTDKIVDDLAVEYTGLFLGPGGHISPHESVHIADQGGLWGDATLAVRQFITETGIEYSTEFSGIPDHISVELEFMAELTKRESLAWNSADYAMVSTALEYQVDFMTEHLGQWVGKFCARVVETADLSFYRDVSKLTAMFIAAESKAIDERLVQAEALAQTLEIKAVVGG